MELRRTITPYFGILIILTIVTSIVFVKAQGIDELKALAVIWIPFLFYYLVGNSYRIFLIDKAVIQKGFGVKTFVIAAEDIRDIKEEASLGETRSFLVQRPYQRIVISSRKDPKGYIDVSLRHFKMQDIVKLLSEIHAMRPDLKLPKFMSPHKAR